MALARHTAGIGGTTRCLTCVHIPVETMRTFWTTLDCHRTSLYGKGEHYVLELQTKDILTLPQAESELSIIGTETSPRSPPAVSSSLPECLDTSEADIIVRASDLTTFPVHKSVLASSSWVFRDMFTLPWPQNNEMVNGLPVVDISEDAELVRSLITIIYPIPSEIPASYDRILALLAAAQKYDMGAVQSSIRAEVAQQTATCTRRAQGLSCVCHRKQKRDHTGEGHGRAPHSGSTYDV
jgi:hypothetical protein